MNVLESMLVIILADSEYLLDLYSITSQLSLMNFFLWILLFVSVAIIVMFIRILRTPKLSDSEYMSRHETFYGLKKDFRDILLTNYNLKSCNKCNETSMRYEGMSPSGQSIRYICVYCNQKITANLNSSCDGGECARAYQEFYSFGSDLQRYSTWTSPMGKLDFNTVFSTNLGSSNTGKNKRSTISEEVKHEVWRRDLAKCTSCGSQENLEFDHIIPFSKGGSNTARNIQLLCQKCNRKKSNNI